jgi:hypothetical protein
MCCSWIADSFLQIALRVSTSQLRLDAYVTTNDSSATQSAFDEKTVIEGRKKGTAISQHRSGNGLVIDAATETALVRKLHRWVKP